MFTHPIGSGIDASRAIIASQTHRRTIDMGHYAKRVTPFEIVRASLPPAASGRTGQAIGPLIDEADHAQGNSL